MAEVLLAQRQLGLAVARLGHVAVGHHPAARRQRVEGDRHDPPVPAPSFPDEPPAPRDPAHPAGDGGFLVFVRELATLGEVAEELLVGQAAQVPVGDLQPFGEAAVVGHDPEIAVQQHHALFDVLEDRLHVRGLAAQLGQVVSDPDIALERPVGGETRRTAHLDRPRGAARIGERHLEIAIRPMVGEIVEMGSPRRIVVVGGHDLGAEPAERAGRRQAEDFDEALRQEGEPEFRIHLPPPVGGNPSQEGELVGHADSLVSSSSPPLGGEERQEGEVRVSTSP